MIKMEFICKSCGRQCKANIKTGPLQTHCEYKSCQRERVSQWQRQKIKTDPEYRANQRNADRKWRESHRDYWSKYRKKNPKKAQRNRDLQILRNKKRKSRSAKKSAVNPGPVIAKMGELSPTNTLLNQLDKVGPGFYWLVPVIAKMDALKVSIQVISINCE